MWSRHRFKLLITSTVVIITVVLILVSLQRPTEPTYKGLTMFQCVARPQQSPAQEEAMIILGTNNLQLLVHRLKYDPTTDHVFTLYSRLPTRVKNVKLLRDVCANNYTKAQVAQAVMQRLGPLAAPAVPQLVQLATNTSKTVASRTLFILHDIGEPGVPGLAAGMSNTNQNVRRIALFYLGIHRKSPAAWHAITNAFTDPDPKIRHAADVASRTNLE